MTESQARFTQASALSRASDYERRLARLRTFCGLLLTPLPAKFRTHTLFERVKEKRPPPVLPTPDGDLGNLTQRRKQITVSEMVETSNVVMLADPLQALRNVGRPLLELGRDLTHAVWLEVDDRLPFTIRSRHDLSEELQGMLEAGRRIGRQEQVKEIADVLNKFGWSKAFEREMQRREKGQQPRRLSVVR